MLWKTNHHGISNYPIKRKKYKHFSFSRVTAVFQKPSSKLFPEILFSHLNVLFLQHTSIHRRTPTTNSGSNFWGKCNLKSSNPKTFQKPWVYCNYSLPADSAHKSHPFSSFLTTYSQIFSPKDLITILKHFRA